MFELYLVDHLVGIFDWCVLFLAQMSSVNIKWISLNLYVKKMKIIPYFIMGIEYLREVERLLNLFGV